MTLPSSGPLSLKDIATELGYPAFYNYSTISNTLNGITGLTLSSVQSSYDDANIAISLPFSISFLGATYSTVYVGSNSYMTFGSGSNAYSNLSGNNPPYPAIQISSADNSYQRVYYGYGTNAGGAYVIRYEGNGSTSETPGASNMIWEIWFYNGNTQIDIHIGSNNKGTGSNAYGISNGINADYILKPVELHQSNNSIRLTVSTGLTNFSLKNAATGLYRTINLYSHPGPTSTVPYSINSWHGYNHSAPSSVAFGLSYNIGNNGALLSDFFYTSQTFFYGTSYPSETVLIYTDLYRNILASNDFYYYDGNNVFYGNPLIYIENKNPSYINLNNNWLDGNGNLYLSISTDVAPTGVDISIDVYWEWYQPSSASMVNGIQTFTIYAGTTYTEVNLGYVDNYGGAGYLNTWYFNGQPTPTYDNANQVYIQG